MDFLTDRQTLRLELLKMLAGSNHYYKTDEYVKFVRLFEKELFSDEPFTTQGSAKIDYPPSTGLDNDY